MRSTSDDNIAPAIRATLHLCAAAVCALPVVTSASGPRWLAQILSSKAFVETCLLRKGGTVSVVISQADAPTLADFRERLGVRLIEVGAAEGLTFSAATERLDCKRPPATNTAPRPRAHLYLSLYRNRASGEATSALVTIWRDGICQSLTVNREMFTGRCTLATRRPIPGPAEQDDSPPERPSVPPPESLPPRPKRFGKREKRPLLDERLSAPIRLSVLGAFGVLIPPEDAPDAQMRPGGAGELSIEYEPERSSWFGVHLGHGGMPGFEAGYLTVSAGYSGWWFGAALASGVMYGIQDDWVLPRVELRLRAGRLDRTHVRTTLSLYSTLSTLLRIPWIRRPAWLEVSYRSAMTEGGAALLGAQIAFPSARASITHYLRASAGAAFVFGEQAGPMLMLGYELRTIHGGRRRSPRTK